jgi:hypothetical protein
LIPAAAQQSVPKGHRDNNAPGSLEITETSVDWGTYPILTFSDVPEMEIVLLDRPLAPAAV